ITDRKFALYGDEGVHGVLPEGTWERLRDTMVAEFAKGRFVEGIAGAVAAIGDALKTHFPHAADDKDELSDELSTSDERRRARRRGRRRPRRTPTQAPATVVRSWDARPTRPETT